MPNLRSKCNTLLLIAATLDKESGSVIAPLASSVCYHHEPRIVDMIDCTNGKPWGSLLVPKTDKRVYQNFEASLCD